MSGLHALDYDGTIEDLKNEEISVNKGVISIGDDDFELKGHNKLNEPERLTFLEGPSGDLMVVLEKKGQDHGGPEGEFAIQNNDGTTEYTDGTPEPPEETQELEETSDLDGFSLEGGEDPSAPEAPTQEEAPDAPTQNTVTPMTYSA